MFDRIARFYDVMNSVMTAGLHHRWRAPRRRPGARSGRATASLDVATGTGDLAVELARRVAPAARSSARTSPSGCSSCARAQGARRCASSGATRSSCPTPTASSTPRPSASARATSPTSTPGWPRWRASCGPAAASSCWRSRRRTRPPLSTFFRVWFDRVVPLLGRLAGDATPTPTCRTPSSASPARTSSPRGMARRRAASTSATMLTAGGIIALHVGVKPRRRGRTAVTPVAPRPSRSSRPPARTSPSCWSASRSAWARSPPATAPELAAHAGATIAAGGKRLRPLLVLVAAGAGRAATTARASCAPAVAVELVHSRDARPRRRARRGARCAAAARRSWPRRAATPRSRPATCCSRARSPSWPPTAAPTQVRGAVRRRLGARRGRAAAARRRLGRDVAVERYLHRCELKTARLFEAACPLGALDGRRRRRAAPLAAFGRRIGLAFQLLDDVLDVSGPAERTGKPRGTDLLDGTVTLPFILARERDPALAALDLRAIDDAGAGRARCATRSPPPARSTVARARAGDGRRGEGRAAAELPRRPAPRARARRRRGRRAVRA